MYRILKNNKIMGQILRNKYGTLERSKIEDTIEIIADSGLRLVNLMVVDENEIADMAKLIKSKNPAWDLNKVRSHLHFLSFLWTMINVEEVVNAINVPDIRESVDRVVARKKHARV